MEMPSSWLKFLSLSKLPSPVLKEKKISLLMLDFDNTIVPYTSNIPTEEMEQWIKDMLQTDIQVCVVSNSKRDRVKVFCEKYGMDCITHAKKPFSKGIRACMEKYGKRPDECALVGDQIFTDTLGGNCAGITSVLVKAIDNHNIWLKLRHVAEIPFIVMAGKRRM